MAKRNDDGRGHRNLQRVLSPAGRRQHRALPATPTRGSGGQRGLIAFARNQKDIAWLCPCIRRELWFALKQRQVVEPVD